MYLAPRAPDSSPLRAIALDIDGTLLTPNRHIAPRTAAAIREALARGVLVVLCTGREYSKGVAELARELRLHLPAIVRNGLAVQNLADGRVLAQTLLTTEAVRQVLAAAVAAGATPLVQEGPAHGDRIYTLLPEQCHPAVAYFDQRWRLGDPLQTFDCVSSWEALYEVPDATWVGGAGGEAATSAVYEVMHRLPGVLARWTGGRDDVAYHMASMQPAGCTKATALAEFAAQHEIALDQFMAIGDYLNDIEMLREVGWGVAMGHAPEVVKAAADAVTLDNEHDGCAVAIEHYVLRSERRASVNASG